MSDTHQPRSVSLITVLAIMGCFALFLLLVYLAYLPKATGPYTGDGIRTPEQRMKILAEVRAHVARHQNSYAWIDQKAGIVQLPIERAMELTAQRYGHAK